MRTTWLVDASVLVAAEDVADANHDSARRMLAGQATVITLDLAYYEVTNVAARAWGDERAAGRLRGVVSALADAAGLVRADDALIGDAAALARRHGLSGYDAAYVAAANRTGSRLVSCDVRDLVAPGLAVLPAEAVRV